MLQGEWKYKPFGEYMLKWIGMLEICFDFPVIRSVSSWISLRTAAAEAKKNRKRRNNGSKKKKKEKNQTIHNPRLINETLPPIVYLPKSVNFFLGAWRNSAYSCCPSFVWWSCNTNGLLVTIPSNFKKIESDKLKKL